MIVLFKNAREVIRADAAASAAGVAHRVAPVPERYSTECGMCLYIDDDQADAFREVMQRLEIEADFRDEFFGE